MSRQITTTGWAVRQDWNPLSPPQVMAYIKSKGYKVPHQRGTGKETTNDEGLNNILTHVAPDDAVLPRVLRLRRLRKGIGYLSDKYVGSDDRFHPIYTFVPKTGRLSAKAPNTMNRPQGRGSDIEAEIAQAIGETFTPFPGHILMEFDWKAIEALLVGYFAQDPTYMRAAKLDIHAAFAAHILHSEGRLKGEMFSWEWDDERLAKYFKQLKRSYPPDRDRAKKGNHAAAYGQSPRSLARDLECSYQDAKRLKEIRDKAWPLVVKWQKETRLRAHTDGQLVNPFGYPLPFFEVFIKKDGKWTLGKEANECLAFLPQSTGAAMLRETLLFLVGDGHTPGLEDEMGFHVLNPNHDAVLLSVPEERADEVREKVKEYMTRPWPELGGLSVDVEAKIGYSLAEMREL